MFGHACGVGAAAGAVEVAAVAAAVVVAAAVAVYPGDPSADAAVAAAATAADDDDVRAACARWCLQWCVHAPVWCCSRSAHNVTSSSSAEYHGEASVAARRAARCKHARDCGGCRLCSTASSPVAWRNCSSRAG